MSKNHTSNNQASGNRPVKTITMACSALFVVPLFILWVILATDDDGNIALVRNDVVEHEDTQTWYGTMGNTTDSQYRDIAVTIQFLDSSDQPVGQVMGSADLLEPGESFNLQARLPAEAVAIRVYSLEWVTGRNDKRTDPPLGPWAPWPFGHVQTSWP